MTHNTHHIDLTPDPGTVRMPGCYDSIADTQDAITTHQAECRDCLVAR